MNILMRFLLILFICIPFCVRGQEYTAPLMENPAQSQVRAKRGTQHYEAKPAALSLPFFEDFTHPGPAPSEDLWEDASVFVNNTMARNLNSRGCATFDALDQYGIPYDSVAPYHQVYADSLTTQLIDLSGYASSDSIYLSFYYQPEGNGFAPRPADSLMLFFHRKDGGWDKVWTVPGDTLHDFRQALIAVTDTSYFYSGFQFRLLNKATHGIGNSDWNVDYIRLDKDRHYDDTLIEDVAYTQEPEALLNDFTAMPFKQFMSNPSSFLGSGAKAYLRNNGVASAPLDFGLQTKELATGTMIGSGSTGNAVFQANEEQAVTLPVPDIASFQPANPSGEFIFENKFYVAPLYPNEPLMNDTVVRHQVFGNYFAYDDGTAEQAYFLHLYPSAPGKVAEEFALYVPDTLRGIQVYFPRQVPSAVHKEFSIAVYKTIAINGQQDDILYQEDYLTPRYEDAVNGFTTYAFEQPVALPAGVFYIAIVQAAGGGSDSLYIGLDKNRTGANHRYFNVNGTWQNSLLDGALLLRPVVGAALPPTGITETGTEGQWTVSPNPAKDFINVRSVPASGMLFTYQIMDLSGRAVLSGSHRSGAPLNIQSLEPGLYFIRIAAKDGKGFCAPKKLIKM